MLHENFEWDEDKAQKNLKKRASPSMTLPSFSPMRRVTRSTSRSTTANTARRRIGT
jgi:hypothetical protein